MRACGFFTVFWCVRGARGDLFLASKRDGHVSLWSLSRPYRERKRNAAYPMQVVATDDILKFWKEKEKKEKSSFYMQLAVKPTRPCTLPGHIYTVPSGIIVEFEAAWDLHFLAVVVLPTNATQLWSSSRHNSCGDGFPSVACRLCAIVFDYWSILVMSLVNPGKPKLNQEIDETDDTPPPCSMTATDYVCSSYIVRFGLSPSQSVSILRSVWDNASEIALLSNRYLVLVAVCCSTSN